MSARPFSTIDLTQAALSAGDLKGAFYRLVHSLGAAFPVERCLLVSHLADSSLLPVEWSRTPPNDDGTALSVLCSKLLQENLEYPITLEERHREPLHALGLTDGVVVPVFVHGERVVTLLLLADAPLEIDPREVRQATEAIATVVERHLSLKALRESEQHYRELAESTTVGILQATKEGVVTYVNPSFEELTGLSFREVRGAALEEAIGRLVYGEDAPKATRYYRQLLLDGHGSRRIQYRLKKRRLPVTAHLSAEGQGLTTFLFEAAASDGGEEARYRRFLEHSEAIIFHTNERHAVTFVSRRALDLFGVAPEDFRTDTEVLWFDLVHRDDAERVRATAVEMERGHSSFDEEFRVLNRLSGRVRWLFVRLVPVLSSEGKIQGWDGFGIDITARREAQEALEAQSRKVRALYAVSSAIRGCSEPSHLAERGLAALSDATGAAGGVCFLHTGEAGGGGEHSELRVIAKSGCLVDARPESTLSATVRQVIDSGHPVVIYDAVSEERGSEVVAIGCGSAVFVPMLGDEGVIGVLGLVAPQKRHFDNGTMTFVGAAANQIGLASRQAELIRRSQQQAQNLSALYRISHELSLNLSLDELFHHAFFILRDELGLERIWLGLLSEAGTRITGQAAYGPGWRRRLVNLNLEIDHSGHPLLQVVKSKSTLFLENPEKELEDVALKRVFSLMDVRSVALVPMVASGQVYGVLAVQPSATDGKLQQEELHLLSSLANELAFVLMTKRLEDRIADGEKMRAAGLFAGGIAHNFNNLLQAVMGQTSLLELQKNDPQKVERAAKLIGEVAMKGAHLVQKLMSFAQLEEPFREWCDVKELVERNFSLLERLTAPNQKLTFRSGVEVSKAFVDPQQVVRILSTIVSNASEAMPDGGPIEIETAQLSLESNPFELEAGEYVQISVRDRGRGMDPETRRRCFEPFFSTKDRDRRSGLSLTGAGLSLAAAYTLAQRNGGILSVESGERLGSVFSLLLPLSQGAAASQGEPRPSVVAGEVKATVPSNVLPLPARISRGEGESPSDNSSGGRARRGSGQK